MSKTINERIQSITEQCKSLPRADIENLPNYKKIEPLFAARSKSTCDIYLILAITFGLLGVFTASISTYGVERFLHYTYDKLFAIDIQHEECLAPKLEFLVDVFRPVTSCDICHGVDGIERVSNITREQFEEKYAYTNRPVIVTDAMEDWLALDKFEFEFFRRLYKTNSSALRAVEEKCQFFPYKNKDEFENLGDVFEMDLERAHMTDDNYRPWYVGWSNCDYSTAYLLRQYYSRPYFLPERSESSKLDWIFMVREDVLDFRSVHRGSFSFRERPVSVRTCTSTMWISRRGKHKCADGNNGHYDPYRSATSNARSSRSSSSLERSSFSTRTSGITRRS